MNDAIQVNCLAISSVIYSEVGTIQIMNIAVMFLSIAFTFYKFYINNKNNNK